MIRTLSEDTVKKIAAGEVIERPASIVKELVENSIDSGANHIIIEIKEGGKSYIRVTDNGSGIQKNQIEKAFLPHSTSKLENFNDLFRNHSLGFRGEALSSIVAVSKVKIKTKTKDDPTGTSMEFLDSKGQNRKEIAMNTGTTMEVYNLFYNVPVRKKFLNKDTTEANTITNLLYRLAIGNPGIGFQYIRDGKIIFETKVGETLKNNLVNLFGSNYASHLIPVNLEKNHFQLRGFIADSNYYRANRGMQYLYLNNRYIENTKIRREIEKAYHQKIPNGRFPSYELFLEMDPALIDVNIHPNKQKVKISFLDDILKDISEEINHLLLSNREIPKAGEERESSAFTFEKKKTEYEDLLKNYSSSISFDPQKINEKDKDLKKIDINSKKDPDFSGLDSHYTFEDLETPKESLFLEEQEDYRPEELLIEDNKPHIISENTPIQESILEKNCFLNHHYIGSFFQTYLLFEKDQNTLLLVDQHAAHERVLYEEFLKDLENKELISQRLLTPEILKISENDISKFTFFQEEFKKFGFDVDLFDDQHLAVRELPIIHGQTPYPQILLEVLDLIDDPIKNKEFIIEKIIQSSCKEAIKSGDQMTRIEVENLMRDLESADYPYTCPHGRPTMIEIEKIKIEKLFMRIK